MTKRARLGDRVRFVRTDVTSEADVQGAVETARTAFGGAAWRDQLRRHRRGAARRRHERPARAGDFARVVGVNLIGTFNVIRLAAAAISTNEPQPARAASGA